MAADLLLWAAKPDSLVVEWWLGINGLHYEACRTLCKKSEIFSEALKGAKQMIGSRREQKALDGEIDAGIVKKTAPLYNPAMANWELKLRGMDNHAVNRALHIICRGLESSEEPHNE